jgi:hypothetical protein
MNKRKSWGFAYISLEKRYIHEYIGSLKTAEDKSMKKLNEFILREEKANNKIESSFVNPQ